MLPFMPSPDTSRSANTFRPLDTCALCLDGEPVGEIPRGPCRGQRACDKCLGGLEEDLALGFYADAVRESEGDDDNSGYWEARLAAL
jgi:hypothetical protein